MDIFLFGFHSTTNKGSYSNCPSCVCVMFAPARLHNLSCTKPLEKFYRKNLKFRG